MAGVDDEFQGESRLSDWAQVSFIRVLSIRVLTVAAAANSRHVPKSTLSIESKTCLSLFQLKSKPTTLMEPRQVGANETGLRWRSVQ